MLGPRRSSPKRGLSPLMIFWHGTRTTYLVMMKALFRMGTPLTMMQHQQQQHKHSQVPSHLFQAGATHLLLKKAVGSVKYAVCATRQALQSVRLVRLPAQALSLKMDLPKEPARILQRPPLGRLASHLVLLPVVLGLGQAVVSHLVLHQQNQLPALVSLLGHPQPLLPAIRLHQAAAVASHLAQVKTATPKPHPSQPKQKKQQQPLTRWIFRNLKSYRRPRWKISWRSWAKDSTVRSWTSKLLSLTREAVDFLTGQHSLSGTRNCPLL
mmetsp:Transcript_9193/g.22535  ORF Transcript_9193/g.22535 Transcript_9193/m.22535 type:complete len:268 (-) Transcript_9193:230-1033(-)